MLFEPFVHRSITFLCRLSPWFKGDFLFSTLAARLSFRTCIENFEFLQIEQSKLSMLISLFRTIRNFAKKEISVSRNVKLCEDIRSQISKFACQWSKWLSRYGILSLYAILYLPKFYTLIWVLILTHVHCTLLYFTWLFLNT